ncbi:MAG: hypothetical protein PVJ67_05175 [Candidatus Pacearchaeota archaeon]|jgi:hypothetical protein
MSIYLKKASKRQKTISYNIVMVLEDLTMELYTDNSLKKEVKEAFGEMNNQIWKIIKGCSENDLDKNNAFTLKDANKAKHKMELY